MRLSNVKQSGEGFLDLLVSASLGLQSELLAKSISQETAVNQQMPVVQIDENADGQVSNSQQQSVDAILQNLVASVASTQSKTIASVENAVQTPITDTVINAISGNSSHAENIKNVISDVKSQQVQADQAVNSEDSIITQSQTVQTNNPAPKNEAVISDGEDVQIAKENPSVTKNIQHNRPDAVQTQNPSVIPLDSEIKEEVSNVSENVQSKSIHSSKNVDSSQRPVITDDFFNQLKESRKSDNNPLGWLLKSAGNNVSVIQQTHSIGSEFSMSARQESSQAMINQQNIIAGMQDIDTEKKSESSFSKMMETTNGTEAMMGKNTQQVQRETVVKVAETTSTQNPQRPEMEKMVLDQVIREIRLKKSNGQNDIYLHLNPPELGSLRVRIVQSPEGIVSQIQASTEHVRNLLQSNLPVLMDGLKQAGVNMDNVSITSGFDLGTNTKDGSFTASQNQNQESQQQRNNSGYYSVMSAIEVGAASADQYNHSSGFNWFA
ncbi:MAG: flagellar hook-length control protein FliK [Armatimonadota bacterium]